LTPFCGFDENAGITALNSLLTLKSTKGSSEMICPVSQIAYNLDPSLKLRMTNLPSSIVRKQEKTVVRVLKKPWWLDLATWISRRLG
jgi:hypothetical protein